MTHFDASDGPRLLAQGKRMVKKPNPVYMLPMAETFTVQTNEGVMKGNAGDYLAHDPISGHVWPVSAQYVEQHYLGEAPKPSTLPPGDYLGAFDKRGSS